MTHHQLVQRARLGVRKERVKRGNLSACGPHVQGVPSALVSVLKHSIITPTTKNIERVLAYGLVTSSRMCRCSYCCNIRECGCPQST